MIIEELESAVAPSAEAIWGLAGVVVGYAGYVAVAALLAS